MNQTALIHSKYKKILLKLDRFIEKSLTSEMKQIGYFTPEKLSVQIVILGLSNFYIQGTSKCTTAS